MPPTARTRTTYVRPTRPLIAEHIAILMICDATDIALTQTQIESALGPPGLRVSIGDAAVFLEDSQFITREQKPPKTAKFLITHEGIAALDKHWHKAVEEIKARIAGMKKPHPRDGTTLDEEQIEPYDHLLKTITTGKFAVIPRAEPEEDDDEADSRPQRPRATATIEQEPTQGRQPTRRAPEPEPEASEDAGQGGEEEPDSTPRRQPPARRNAPARRTPAPKPESRPRGRLVTV